MAENGRVTVPWPWVASALLALVLALMTISWQSQEATHHAQSAVLAAANEAAMRRLTTVETRQEDVRERLTRLESAHQHETLSQLTELRERLRQLEQRLLSLRPQTP